MRLNPFKYNIEINNYQHKPKKLSGFKLLISFLFTVLILGSIYFSYPKLNFPSIEQSTAYINKFSIFAGLKLDEIHVIGRKNLSAKQIINSIGLTQGSPILTIDLKQVQEKLLKIGWVKNVAVERKLPNIILIKLEEFSPFALLQVENTNYLVSSEGTKITSEGIGKFSHLPVIMGNDAEKNATKMLNILTSEPALFHQVWAISYIGKRRWDVHLRSGIKIKLPENKPAEAWTRLAEIDRKNFIISRDIISIDLRVNGNLIIESGINRFENHNST